MELLRRSFRKAKKRSSTLGSSDKPTGQKLTCIRNKISESKVRDNICESSSSWDCCSDKVFSEEGNVGSAPGFLGSLRMRFKKDVKCSKDRPRSGLKPDNFKRKKTESQSFRSKVVYPKRVKTKSTWVHRLLSKSNDKEESFTDYFQTSAIEFDEPVHKMYSAQFMHCEHFNLIGEDKNLGPLVLSIKYPTQAVDTNSDKSPSEGDLSSKTSLLLRLPTGTIYYSWNQFQLSNTSYQSPLYLAKLSFPTLSVGKLLPVLCPEAWLLIAEYDRTSEDNDVFEQSKTLSEDKKEEIANRSRQLKELQQKLISSTCKFLELSDWNFIAYDTFFTKKKPNLFPNLSFTMPSIMKIPRSVKSPNSSTLTKSLLQIESEQMQSSPLQDLGLPINSSDLSLNLDNTFDISSPNSQTSSASVSSIYLVNQPDGDLFSSFPATLEPTVPSKLKLDLTGNLVLDLTESLMRLGTDNYLDERLGTGLGSDADQDSITEMKLRLKKLKIQKEELLVRNSTLEKEETELRENETRLVRELATANSIINSLKKVEVRPLIE
eukprot:GFUD01019342.1.p1 GENE.GFUD01019342.1~~GFUD01019342.1.p1  ORF type:complete len:547 (+),score=126.90 GFUD01019342.1:85-1725(+)